MLVVVLKQIVVLVLVLIVAQAVVLVAVLAVVGVARALPITDKEGSVSISACLGARSCMKEGAT